MSAYNHTSHGALDMQTASDVFYNRVLRVSGARPEPLLELAKGILKTFFRRLLIGSMSLATRKSASRDVSM